MNNQRQITTIMAELKKRVLKLSTGKQVKLYGNSLGIGRSLEIGEGYAPTVLSAGIEPPQEKGGIRINNPYHLTANEIMELSDYMMGLWLQLKENVRRYGLENPKIFVSESSR